ncbi:hypothetical protein NFJ02_39g97500 [Pycnococcus provasolii]
MIGSPTDGAAQHEPRGACDDSRPQPPNEACQGHASRSLSRHSLLGSPSDDDAAQAIQFAGQNATSSLSGVVILHRDVNAPMLPMLGSTAAIGLRNSS